ncbi:diiron oxygenase [Zooshikella ganghwensis]|uniref:Diiron oxygenase n=1 Tax=Zooshikella ganghwensis TaxID=202772 RepID=A0A4V1IN12_9GAMM|nr:diiron oxygenase [Zooshikella ganghwensis]RDH42121.1 hypothetical protein B9G39_00940 [Zooshikella ganghwensis]
MTLETSVGNTQSFGLSSKYVEKWEKRSSIRTRPEKKIDFELDGFFFPEDKQPVLLDGRLKDISIENKSELLIRSLFKYLNDIVTLEIKLINSACNKIIYNDLPVAYPEQIKMNAYTVIIDEYYHVYVARDLINQLKARYPYLTEDALPDSDSFCAVNEIMKRLDAEHHDLFEIIAVCIFETTLVKELVEFFKSESVHPSIKNYVNDHMNDESRHYIYFLELLQYTWDRLPDKARRDIGSNIADFVKMYLNIESEKEFNLNYLDSIIADHEENKQTVNAIYKGFEVTPDVPIVKNVISALKRTGLLDDENVKSGFTNIGWII